MATNPTTKRRAWCMPWTLSSMSIEFFLGSETSTGALASEWRDNKIQELGVVNVTAALIASVVSGAFSWPTVEAAPWTTKATLYSTLIIALCAVAAASQQSIALNRYGQHPDGLEALQKLLRSDTTGSARQLQLYVWQLPVMLLNISIALFLIALIIMIWARAAFTPGWDDNMKIAFFVTLAGLFALVNYGVGWAAIYLKRA